MRDHPQTERYPSLYYVENLDYIVNHYNNLQLILDYFIKGNAQPYSVGRFLWAVEDLRTIN